MTECMHCGTPIHFVKRWSGKAVPCDAQPEDNLHQPILIETAPNLFEPHYRHDCSDLAPARRLELSITRLNFGNGASGEIWNASGLWKLDSNILEGAYREMDVE